MYFFRRKF